MKKKLAIVITHPIQYYAPVFRLLTERANIQVKVFYSWHAAEQQFDKDFGKKISWDISLLEGYDYFTYEEIEPKKRTFWSLNYEPVKNAIISWNANAILVFGWNYWSHLRLMRYFKHKIPVYFRGDSILNEKSSIIKKWVRKQFLTWIYKKIDFAFIVGALNKAYFLEYGVKERQLVFVPHAVDNKHFGQLKSNKILKEFGTKLNINQKKKTIIFVGKFSKKKRPNLILQAFVNAGMKKSQLVLIGDGELKCELETRYGLTKNISFLPFVNQSELPYIYNLADVLVLSSGYGETWGLVVNEAFAGGTPAIVSSKVGCGPDLVIDGKTGWRLKHDTLEELSSVFRTIDNTEKRKLIEVGKNSKALIQNWNFNKICEAIEGVLIGNYDAY